jgi:hypothetical protein
VRKVALAQSLRIIGRGPLNWIARRPIAVSFEVTDCCTCWCKHCDHGGPRDLQPADYRRYVDALRPCVVRVSRGEPLMRRRGEHRAQHKFGIALHNPGLEPVAHEQRSLSFETRDDCASQDTFLSMIATATSYASP